MYLRTTQRKNKDGTVVRYVQLAHNRRVDGVTQADVLVNLGREDLVDRDGLARLVASINRYLGVADPTLDVEGLAGSGLTVTGSRPVGTAWLVDGLWHNLGIDAALGRVVGARRFTTDVERVVFALVANRVIDPMSKLSAAEWASNDVAITGLESMDEDQAYRAMDVLADADTEAKVQEAVFFSVADLLNLEVDVVLFDTTNTYFERDTDEDEGGFRRYGHSKDHRDDLPQVVIGLAVTKEGIPVRCWWWPGNTSDMDVLPQVKDAMRDWRLGRVITVVDRGFSSEDNLAYLLRAGGHYIAGDKMRDGSPLAQTALSQRGRYRQVRDNLRVKEVHLDAAPGRRWVICVNPGQAELDKATRERQLDTVRTELARIDTLRQKAAKRKSGATGDPPHVKAECALRDNTTLGRWVTQLDSGRLRINRAKIAAEERLDGKYLLVTSDPSLTPEEIAIGYTNLLEAERGFRDMKSTLDLRPVYHRLESRIRAHVLLCWLALLVIRVAERSTHMTWRRIAIEMGRVHAVTLTGDAGTVVHTTPLTSVHTSILHACDVTPPPTITTLEPS